MTVIGVPGPPAPEEADDGVRHKLNPLTPLALLFRVFGLLVVVVYSEVEGHGSQAGQSDSVIVTLSVVGAFAVLLLARGVIAVATTRYWVSGGELRVDSGLLSRQHKRARLSRVQSIDVHTPLAARIMGLAELRVTTAGTESASIRLRFLSESVAQRLRAELLGRSAGWGEGAAEAPEQPLVVVPHGTLIGSSILHVLSWRLIPLMIGPALTAFSATSAAGAGGAGTDHSAASVTGITLSVTVILYVGHSIFRRVTTLWEFTVAESPDGLRVRHGLLSTSAQTVPYGRIQALRIHQPLAWRPFGWVMIQMNVAGYAGKREGQNTVLLPVGPRAFSEWLVSRVLADDVGAVPLTAPPARAAWRSPIWWRRQRVGTDARLLVAQHGWFSRSTEYVPHERTQSVALSAGPWQRRLGLATVELDSTRGPVKIRCRFRDQHEARAMLDAQAERARQARNMAARPFTDGFGLRSDGSAAVPGLSHQWLPAPADLPPTTSTPVGYPHPPMAVPPVSNPPRPSLSSDVTGTTGRVPEEASSPPPGQLPIE